MAALDILSPVFGLILLGYVLGRPPLFGPDAARTLGTFVFNLALPVLLFRTLATAGAPDRADLALLGTYYLSLPLLGLSAFAGARLLMRTSAVDSVITALGASFSNLVLVGVPTIGPAFGPQGLRLMLLIVTFHALFLLSSATLAIEALKGRAGGSALRVIGTTLMGVLRNPIIVGLLSGLAWGATGWHLHGPFDRLLALLGSAGTPCALFALGMQLVGLKPRDIAGACVLPVAFKLLGLPLIVWLVGHFVFDLAPLPLGVAVTCATLPTGVNPFVFAQRYQIQVTESAGTVLLSTVLSLGTIAAALTLFAPVR